MMRALAVMVPVMIAGCTTMQAPVAAKGPCVLDEQVKMRFAAVKFRPQMVPEIERATHSAISRVLRPGEAATMDFRPERVSIRLDDGGQIDGLRCG